MDEIISFILNLSWSIYIYIYVYFIGIIQCNLQLLEIKIMHVKCILDE